MSKTLFLMLVAAFFSIALPAFAEQSATQTQVSTSGTLEMRLTDAKQKDGVVTIKSVVKNISGQKQPIHLCYQGAYLLDQKDKKKYMPLKDTEGEIIGGPKDFNSGCNGGGLDRHLVNEQQAILWLRFPAPVSQASEVDCVFPNFLPFEDVVIQNASKVGNNGG